MVEKLRNRLVLGSLGLILGLLVVPGIVEAQNGEPDVHVVVMDPLSDRLACDCVQGYAQRKYQYLGEHLEKELGRKVHVHWGESVAAALEDLPGGTVPDLIIGKHSVVVADVAGNKWDFTPVASLSGQDGSTTQTGLIVVRKDDPATTVADLDGYRIFFGPANCDEKSAAPMDLLREFEVAIPKEPETCSACSKAASELMALPAADKAAAVISSYAAPLLEGCGTIKKGDLRVIGESDPVPFIVAFLDSRQDPSVRDRFTSALLSVGAHTDLLKSLETRDGFVPFRSEKTGEQGADSNGSAPSSSRGPSEDAVSAEKKS